MRLEPHAPPSDEESPRSFTTSGLSVRRSAAGVLLLPVLFLSFGACGPQEVDPALVIRGATLIDGTGDPPRSGTTIVIRGGQISALGPDQEVEVPDGSTVVDGSGRYVIPGLWDLHVHLAKAGGDVLPLFTANGVTGIRDMGGDAAYVSEVREAVRAGQRIGPRIVMAGPIVESGAYMERARHRLVVEPVRRFRAGVGSPERAQVVVDSVAALGADFIKIRTTEDLETYHAIANAARRNGLDMVGHAENIPAEDLLRSGQRSVEHLLFPFLTMRKPAEARRLAREFAEAGTAFVPTLVGFTESMLASSDDLASMLADTTGDVEPRRAALAGFLIADWQEQLDERIAEDATGDTLPWDQLHQAQLADLRLLHEAGVPILPGTDIAVLNVFPGSSLHDELVLLVDLVGLSPMEAIEAATRGAARLVGMEDEVGTVRPGLAADLVILDADPLDDIAHTRRIVGVVQRGVYHGARELEELRASVRARAGVVRRQPTEDTGIQVAPSGLFELVASVGPQSIPVRLEILSIEGRPWGRLIVSVGQDLVSAVQGHPTPERGWAFAVGGPIRGMELTFGDLVTGTLELAGSPPIPLEGHRTMAVESANRLRVHHVLTSLGLAERAGEKAASFPAGTGDGALIFARHGPDLTHQTLMTAEASPGGWREPRLVFAPHSHSDRSPAVTPDGSGLVFASDRPMSGGEDTERYALWLAHRGEGGRWEAPAPLALDGGWAYDARQPAVTADNTLYFSSNAPEGRGEGDIYVAEQVAPGRWGVPRNLGEVINGPGNEHGAFVAPDGSYMILTSAGTRPGSQGGDDLYLSLRTGDGWSEPRALDLPVNTFANEYGAWVSPADGHLYFTSDRYGYADIFRVSREAAGLPGDQ